MARRSARTLRSRLRPRCPRRQPPRLPARLLAAATLVLLAASSACAGREGLVLAHRGASGWLPEHSLEAYTQAIALGVDFVEPDVVLTRDGVLVCSHDLTLDEEAVDLDGRFDDRRRADGRLYLLDLTWDELAGVRRVDPRDPPMDAARFVTLEELLQLVRRLGAATGRAVGVIPEPKDPAFHRREGRPLEGPLVELLARYGYTSRDDRAVIQCFDADALWILRAEHGTDLRLVHLSSDPWTDAALDRLATFVDGIGPSRALVESDAGPTDLVARAHARGLFVYCWTFGDEAAAMARFYDEHGVDGLFTDFPATALASRGR